MKVEVELDDLETLIFGTAALKAIEASLQHRKQDPFVKPHNEFVKAHDNLVTAMNHARRATSDAAIAWNGELSVKETKFLKQFLNSPVFEIDGEFRKKHEEVDSLMAKGCLRCGQLVAGAVWPGEERADIKPVAGFALSVTKRGTEKLELIMASELTRKMVANRIQPHDAG